MSFIKDKLMVRLSESAALRCLSHIGATMSHLAATSAEMLRAAGRLVAAPRAAVARAGAPMRWAGGLMLLGFMFSMSSCKDEVDTSNMFTAKRQTMFEYIDSVPNCKSMAYIFRQVKLGDRADASSLASVLSAYGNYTCFLPNDSVVARYVSALHTDTTDLSALTPEEMRQIAYSCIIDNGTSTAYTLSNFQTNGSLGTANLADRQLTVSRNENDNSIYINGCRLTQWDIQVSNGYLHMVDSVVSPSTNSVSQLMATAPNMRVMSYLLEVTGWADSITAADYDRDYEKVDREEYRTQVISSNMSVKHGVPVRRYLGYTVFAETDDVYAQALGLSLPEGELSDETKQQILQKIAQEASCYTGSTSNDLTNPDNAINRYVAYHIMPGRFAYNELVHHSNEYGYSWGADALDPQSQTYSVDVWDYYCTAGKDRYLLKVLQVPDGEHEMYLNRLSEYNDSIYGGDYKTLRVVVPGQQITADNGNYDNNGSNGMYFPIVSGGLLKYDATVTGTVLNDRIRFDLVTMLPELVSCGARGKRYRSTYDHTVWPNTFFNNIIDVADETNICYLVNTGSASWRDHQGDEFLFAGLFDFTIKLPPVPRADTYEIRMGTSNNPYRGMAQAYFGEKDNMKPAGLPIDLRVGEKQEWRQSISWYPDNQASDEDEIRANEKAMRNQDWMKAPNYITVCNGKGDTPLRNSDINSRLCLRRIIAREYMEPGKTYYLRFKTCLNDQTAEFFVDYFEIVPKTVFDNPAQPEDIW